MNPFEDLIHELGQAMGITLHPDTHESCRLHFPTSDLDVQIDLDLSADQILVGCQIAQIPAGVFRDQVFTQAMRVNGTSTTPRGILAFSEKNDSLVLFQFLELATLSGEKLHNFVQLFHEHAHAWKEALDRGEVPPLAEESGGGAEEPMFGLKR